MNTIQRLFGLLCVVLGPALGLSAGDPLAEADALEQAGRFQQAAAVLGAALEKTVPESPQRKLLAFELDRLERIKQDFPLTRDQLFEQLQRAVKDLTREEFDGWVAAGRFDSRSFDGQRRFMVSSVSNLFFRYPELDPRRLPPRNRAELAQARWTTCQAIREAARAQRQPYVLPKRFAVRMTVTAQAGAAPAEELVRAWLPVPRKYPFQGDFEFVSASPPLKNLDSEQSPIRSAYFEQVAPRDKPIIFRVDYRYTTHGVWFDIDPAKVQPAPVTADLEPFVAEAPHVGFTPEMRALSERIAGAETNHYRLAKKFHDWIADHIKYSYAIEYSTVRNLGDYCRTRGYGDCGQEALLFITLCRLNGIPARWQSGWNTFPGAKTIHDWAEIHLAPYGWIPVDTYMGIFAMQYADTLDPRQRREVRDFYFGGLDAYRMIANSDHNQVLTPPRKAFRSDTVDFQRGELEWGHSNIYLDKFTYDLRVEEIKPEH